MRDEDFCCSVCLDFFVEPAIISCGHSFCLFCIESHLNINEKCPLCRSHAGHPVKNRQLESITMSYVASRKVSDEYYERMKMNQKRLLLQKRALVIIWTTLNSQPRRSTELCNIVKNIEDSDLKSEIIRQVYQQDGVGLERIGEFQGEATTISLKTSRS